MPDDAGPDPAGPDVPRARSPRRRRHRHRAEPSGLRRPAVRGSLLGLGLAALVGGAGLLPAALGDDAPRAADPAPVATSSAPAPAGGPVTAWLDAALPEATDLAASTAVRRELTGTGVPADRLRPAEGGVPAGTLLAVVGTAPEGARVVAAFDRPGDGSRLLVVDPAPAEPTAEELDRRRSLAQALLANPTTRADGAAGEVLREAAVDPRLLGVLAAVTASDGVGIAAFRSLPGEEGTALPARRVLVDSVGGAPVPGDPTATERLRAWLAAQLPPFAPDDVEVTDTGVLVSFRYVSGPDALVGAATR
ncbi:hypothetical protein SAMN06273567_105180 [Geodermatophilus aquaeductus]|uniref:Uncharacterized protein n=1 Tax=Geodermatophilus aquaeductus TaxID=1564161 RepID=A0A521EJI8_9ACTN|nr:hypothetical protein SAMN06273567_105180 [Geodermatophilus aquaeductus]